jgi:rubrerythrin
MVQVAETVQAVNFHLFLVWVFDMEWEEAEKLVEKVYPKYEKQIEKLFRKGLKQLKHFTCCICGYGEFDINKRMEMPQMWRRIRRIL